MNKIYLDHSATTPVDARVVKAMSEYMLNAFGNPSSIHGFGRIAKEGIENARDQIALLLNCYSSDIYFTSGGTEADNLAMLGYALQNREKGNHIIISDTEHPAVLKSSEELERQGFSITQVKSDRLGMIHPETVESALTDETILVSVLHVNNEVGTINDIGKIGKLLRERNIIFHTDAVQSFGKVPVDVESMSIDMLSLSGHKIYGPKGIGALFIRNGIELRARNFGGQQESGVRSGTENLPGIIGLGQASEICREELATESAHLKSLREELFSLISTDVDDIMLNGHPEKRLPGNLNLSFNGIEGEALLMALDLKGIAVSTGSACSSGSSKPSRVLLNIGLSEQEAQSSIRFTLGRHNTLDEINMTAKIIVKEVKRFREMAS